MQNSISQNVLLTSGKLDKEKEYWHKKFSDNSCFGTLPYDSVNSGREKAVLDSVSFCLNKDIYQRISDLCNQSDHGIFMVLLTAINYLIFKYSDAADFLIGTNVFERNLDDRLLNSTLALRCRVTNDMTCASVLMQVKSEIEDANQYANYFVEKSIQELRTKNNISEAVLFDVQASYTSIHDPRQIDNTKAHISFNFSVDTDGQLLCRLWYNRELYNRSTINRFKDCVMSYLAQALPDLQRNIGDINIVLPDERRRILYDYNDTGTPFAREKTIYELFETQAAENPSKIALICGTDSISFEELNHKANQLARYLLDKGVTPGKAVGILLPRSIEYVVGLLAIMKIGGVCLPLDKNYPGDRINMMVEDSQAEVVLCMGDEKARLASFYQVVDFDEQILSFYENTNINARIDSKSLVYLIYTSGSLGKPKGVMLNHIGINNHSFTKIKELSISFSDIIGHNLSFSFVASIWKVWAALSIGAQVVLFTEDIMRSPYELFTLIDKNKVSVAEVVPSVLNSYLELLAIGEKKIKFNHLKIMALTGEQVSAELVNKFYRNYTVQLVNAYGQSECSDDTLHYKIPFNIETKTVPIGKPSNNTRVYILDPGQKLQPVGVRGELFISGEGLAPGYFNRPELTAEKFINNPFEPNTLMYQTGDFARWNADGNIEFLGRVDHQVKIRGFRVEIAEIEIRLLKHEVISDGIVTVKKDRVGNSYLCAYIVLKKAYPVDKIKTHLTKELPDYMIPSHFIKMESLPLTPNGKINRNALPEPDDMECSKREIVTPSNDIEQKLHTIYTQLLDLETVSIFDGFFESRGNSLSATICVSKIYKEFSVNIPLNIFFTMNTISEVAQYIINASKNSFVSIEPVKNAGSYQLSSSQKRIFILNQLEKPGILYNLPYLLKLEGPLDIERLEEAFDTIITRHEALRTSFELTDIEPVQKISRTVDFKIERKVAKSGTISTVIDAFIRPFDISKAPLFRACIVELGEMEHILLFDIHHIIADETSINILINEISNKYNQLSLPDLSIQYKDFANWQNKAFKSDEMKTQERYWLDIFKKDIVPLNLPLDFVRPVKQSFQGSAIQFEIDPQITEKLHNFALETGSTLFMILLTAFTTLLMKYSGQEDIVVGSPVQGKSHPDLENVVGVFINTLALRNYPEGGKQFVDFIDEVRLNSIKAFENQEYPFESLVDNLALPRDMSRNPLFDVMFSFHNTNRPDIKLNGLRVSEIDNHIRQSKFDITLNGTEEKGRIKMNLEYCTALFTEETMRCFTSHFLTLLKICIANPSIKLKDIDLISEEDRFEQLQNFNNTLKVYEQNKTIHGLFEEQAAKNPDNYALVCKEKSYSYKKLNERANHFARILKKDGVGQGAIVGIMINRSFDMIAALLGILKTGAAYLPLDREYPQKRIEYILQNSNVEVVLSQDFMFESIDFKGKIIYVDRISESKSAAESSNLEETISPDVPAYLIYTSGSTGLPKGVIIEHKAVTNFITGITDIIDFSPGKTILGLTTISFDIFVLESLLALSRGLKIILADETEQKDPALLNRLIKEKSVQMLQVTPSRMELILNEEDCELALSGVSELMIGGEACSDSLLESLKSIYKGRIYNMYGPTETTVWSSVKELTGKKKITIGKPIANTRMYVLDNNLSLLPRGVQGELYIAGSGLARGYFNQNKLTSERFLPDPFKEGEQMYKTGDVARWLPDGELEFLGRCDHQVKIHGYRIELGEIECTLNKLLGTREVVVDKRGTGDAVCLVVYYVLPDEIDINSIREKLSKNLPYYMIPSFYIRLDKIPLTGNQKVDRKQLPDPDSSSMGLSGYKAPVNKLEKELVRLWEQVLSAEKVGINDNFFSIGGNSILLIKMHKQLDRLYPGKIEISDLFSYSTIAAIARLIVDTDSRENYSLEETLIPLPADYFYRGEAGDSQSLINFDLDKELSKKLKSFCSKHSLTVFDCLFSLYIYLFSKVSGTEEFSIHTALEKAETISLFRLKIEQDIFSRFEDFMHYISTSFCNQKSDRVFALNQVLTLTGAKKSRTVRPLFFREGLVTVNTKLLKYYDIVLGITETDERISLNWETNAKYLVRAKSKELATGYINMIRSLVKQVENEK